MTTRILKLVPMTAVAALWLGGLFTLPALAQGAPGVFPPQLGTWQFYDNLRGSLAIVQTSGDVDTRSHPFFQSLGTNGRSCASCHQPSDAMSLNTATLKSLWVTSGGKDPVFAAIDGANCPDKVGVQAKPGAHSLLLQRGLFRVALPVPKNAEFTVQVVSDPNGCNTKPAFATRIDPVTGEKTKIVSVYRRPRMAANLKFMTKPALTMVLGVLPNIDMVTGEPVVDSQGMPISGNIMWDGREPSLESQAVSAVMGHAQALQPPSAEQVAQIVAYENSVFAAQWFDRVAGSLMPTFDNAVTGGAYHLSVQEPNFGNFTTFDAWRSNAQASRASIARGQGIFNTRPIVVGDVAGFNNAKVLNISNPTSTTCSSCHGGLHAGSDPLPAGQRDIGIGGQGVAFGGPAPSTDLPVFKIVCKEGKTTAFLGKEMLTNDPGKALITGRCADVGRKSVPQIRAMAARAPYFSDGSAATIRDVVEFYDKRFSMGMTRQDKNDLINFLKSM